jgi:hypothetical protein
MADDPEPIARLWADAYVARHGPAQPETALEWAARDARERRAAALERCLADLSRGYEPRETDIAPLRAEPDAHLRYLDARDEALALHGGELAWDHVPEWGQP